MRSPPRQVPEQFYPAGALGPLPATLTDAKPLAFTAARKSERIVAKRFTLMPTATGLMVASSALIAATSSTDGRRLLAEERRDPLHGGTQVAQPGGGKVGLALERAPGPTPA